MASPPPLAGDTKTSACTQKRRDTGTEKKPREDGGRDWRYVATSLGMLGAPRSQKRQEGFSPGACFFFFLIFFPPWSLLRKQDTDLGLRLLFSRTSASAQSLSHVQLFAAPWTVACQAPLFTEFSRQEYWRGLLFPTPGDPLDWGTMNICCLRPQFGVFCYSCPRPLTH